MMKKRIGITGQNGFVGSYLYNTISLLKDEFEIVPFQRTFFEDADQLHRWVSECDVIVHLAAINRHSDPQFIYDTNVHLVQLLIDAARATSSKPHMIISSSTQEERDNLYGNSKKKGRLLLKEWSEASGATVTGLIIPNIFGPFGKPFYNSVVATFCHQLCNQEQPKIDVDGSLKLIYVGEVVDAIIEAIRSQQNTPELLLQYSSEKKVSDILSMLQHCKTLYLDKGIIPELPDRFSLNLFNTFRSYIDHSSRYPFKLVKHTDERGSFIETIRLMQGGQVSFSTTVPGVTRGNHFHTRKIERFTVIKGKAKIQLRKYNTSEVLEFELDGENPSYVDMPIWYTHNISNIGEGELYTIFWINEFYDPNDADTYFETV